IASLEDLQAALALYGSQQFLSAIQQASLGKTGREAVLAIAHAYRDVALANPGIYELMLRAPSADQPDLHEVSEQIVQYIMLVLTAYGLHGEAALHAVRGVRSLAHGFVSLELAGGFGLNLSRDESYARLVETFLDGLG
ncbi:MAG: WHG domain-containing protein, partial [Anaerolineales bacterium]|nr:WHG domain-containing protein [Anaerolineales bacterium]